MRETLLALLFAGVLSLALAACRHGASSGMSEGQSEADRALEDAQRLAEEGDYEGALQKHTWYHNNALAVDEAQYGVRLSFALADWVKLGEKYPKALEELKKIRDAKTARLLGGEANRELFHDVQSINENLDESEATVELFKKLDGSNPAFASEVYTLADADLVQAGEYALARKYLGDPSERMRTAQHDFETGLEYAKTSSVGQASREAHERIFTREAVRIIAVLQKTGDTEFAKEMQSEALKSLDNAEIRNALAP